VPNTRIGVAHVLDDIAEHRHGASLAVEER